MKTGVVLLNWNGGEFTLPCLASLLEGTTRPWRIVVVDNASTDGSPDRIAAAHPDVTLLRLPENIGFAAGNNVGIRHLMDAGADAVWILNNDTVVDRHCLARLEAFLERTPSAAAVSGKILYLSPPDRLWYAGGDLRRPSMTALHRGLDQPDDGTHAAPAQVSFLSGCCMLIRREGIERIGVFDERYFIYHEDAEWCFRAEAAGQALWYHPEAILFHNVSASVVKNTLAAAGGRISPRAHYLNMRNRLFTIRLHRRGKLGTLAALLLVFGRALVLTAGLAARGRLAKVTALLRGLRDGMFTPLSMNASAETPSISGPRS